MDPFSSPDTLVIRALILVAAGMGAGFVNVLAGGGSMLTLPILILAGLDPTTANGTNRLSILLQNVTATTAFQRRGFTGTREGLFLALWAIPGAIVGAITGARIDNLWFQRILVLVLLLSVATLFLPQRARRWQDHDGRPSRLIYPAMLGLGFYGGFIQLGIGFLFMAALRQLMRVDLVHVNAYKVLIISLYTLPTVLVFALLGKMDWTLGLAVAVGSMGGAWLAAHVSAGRRGELWVRVVVAVMVIGMVIKLWI